MTLEHLTRCCYVIKSLCIRNNFFFYHKYVAQRLYIKNSIEFLKQLIIQQMHKSDEQGMNIYSKGDFTEKWNSLTIRLG